MNVWQKKVKATSRKRKYGCENDERMFIYSKAPIQGIHSFNARIGEREHNGDIIGGPGAEVVGLNGMQFI